jgi:hypothetical protein
VESTSRNQAPSRASTKVPGDKVSRTKKSGDSVLVNFRCPRSVFTEAKGVLDSQNMTVSGYLRQALEGVKTVLSLEECKDK